MTQVMTMSRFAFTLIALLSMATFANAEEVRPRRGPGPEARAEGAHRPLEASRRAQMIERARQEIQKNPSQKKFILFRYGIVEGDLR